MDTAALEYARALPGMLRRAMKRAARGKPSPLLRSAPRLIRECAALLEMQEDKRARKPRPLAGLEDLGPLSDFERTICRDTIGLIRQSREGKLEHPPTAEPAPMLEREATEEPPACPAPQRPQPYTGPDRRVRHIPSTVFLGDQERRRRQERATVKLIDGQRVVYIGEPPTD